MAKSDLIKAYDLLDKVLPDLPVEQTFEIFSNPNGEYVTSVRITGNDDEDCQVQLEAYLERKQDCYAMTAE